MQSESLNYDRDVTCGDVDGLLILPMYGSMVSAEQQRIFQRAPPGMYPMARPVVPCGNGMGGSECFT